MVIDDPTVLGQEQLRDPRERRLRHVRQLTRSRWVAMPRFSADGRWIYVAEKRAKQIVLLRVSTSDPSKGVEELAPPDPGSAFWGLVDGKGGPCAVGSKKVCTTAGWPETETLLGCETLTLTPLAAGSPNDACPPLRGSLPCARGAQGSEVCPVRVEDAVRLVLWKPSAVTAVPLGPASGSSWMPSLSRNGTRLVFVNQASPGVSHLMVSFIDHPDPQPEPLGPEAARTLDPTFTVNGDRVVFASTTDDAAGQELDLSMVGVIGGALERITFTPGVDRFPTFSPDGHSIAWVSERDADAHAQDLFIAEWVSDP
jgi:dipeptidyl aminopeptidase/acylaminoacyl peptidase